MEKFKLLLFLISAQLVLSCKSEYYEIKISNNADSDIDSLYVDPGGFSPKKFIDLKTGHTKIYSISLNDFPESDGCYVIKYKLNGKWELRPFGYFTNGAPLETGTYLDINNATIKTQSYRY